MSSAQRPTGRRYSMGSHGHSETSERFGNFLFRSGAGVEVWKPSWTGGPTTVRFWPGKHAENPGGWDPFRFSNEPRMYGDWIRRYPAVRSFGDPGCTFIIKDPADDSIQLSMTPAWVLYDAVERIVKAKQDPGWGGYLTGGSNRGAQLSRPSEVYLAQCCITQHKGKVKDPFYGAADDKLVVLEMGTSAGRALLDLCDTPREGYNGPNEDYDAMYQSGDIVNPAAGRYVTFYSMKDGDPRQSQAQGGPASAAAAFGVGASSRHGGSGRTEEIGYGCYTEPTFRGVGAAITPIEAVVHRKVQLWDDILRFPTLEEQAALIATRFPPKMICYAWQDHPEWIPDGVRERAVAAVSVAGGFDVNAAAMGSARAGFAAPAGTGFGAPAQGGFGGQQVQPGAGGGFIAPAPAPAMGMGQPAPTPAQGTTDPNVGMGFGAPAAGFGAPAQQSAPFDASVPTGGIPGGVGDTAAPGMLPVEQPAAGTGNVARDALARARSLGGRS